MISVIIPCYNSGEFLPEAISSVVNSGFSDFELIIVNDGSSDPLTLEVLGNLNSDQIIVISQENQGPATARNRGVKEAKGEFLLFLDSDNLVFPQYLSKGVTVLKNHPAVGVVYSHPEFFGAVEEEKRFEPIPFDFQQLLLGNYIDMCSFVRRSTFEEVGGFDEHPDLIGWEDWELWLRIAQSDWRFHHLDETLFKYRVRPGSLMGQSTISKKNNMLSYLGQKHGKLFHELLRSSIRTQRILEKRTFQFWVKKWLNKFSKNKR
jgi:glycosyltransferase involved in cell wall biosynthesis